jgi:hypothetical protein
MVTRIIRSFKISVSQTGYVRFQVLTAVFIKFKVFCDVAPCRHVEVDRCFRDGHCFLPQGDRPDDGGSTPL